LMSVTVFSQSLKQESAVQSLKVVESLNFSS
jgi:hypothetical protein